MATLKERKELIDSLKIPGRERTAGLRQDADAWLRNWRNERGINPNSGVIPNDPAEAPAHLRFIIFGRRASTTPQRDSLKAEIPNWDTGGGLGPDAKRRLLDEEYQNDVIKQVLDGTMSFSDGAQILQMEETEFEKFMNDLKPNEGTSPNARVKDLLIKSR
tara:strand:+ start:24 stop:506 length:483 start_codon:yes stop_codon:yes gene_type:complete